LLTGYAVTFNRRHNRSGHLFQNRYKSIVCEKETHLLELIRYIHLNPLRTGLVKKLSELDLFLKRARTGGAAEARIVFCYCAVRTPQLHGS